MIIVKIILANNQYSRLNDNEKRKNPKMPCKFSLFIEGF